MNVENWTPGVAGGKVTGGSCSGTQPDNSSKCETVGQPVVLDIYPRKMKTYVHTKACT